MFAFESQLLAQGCVTTAERLNPSESSLLHLNVYRVVPFSKGCLEIKLNNTRQEPVSAHNTEPALRKHSVTHELKINTTIRAGL